MPWPRIDGLRTMEIGSPGAMRAELTGLVLAGHKVGTAGLFDDYAGDGEELEHVGEILVLVDDVGAEIGRIRVTQVVTVPFTEVTDEFARSEGEGYAGWQEWADSHRAFWEQYVEAVTDDTLVTCISFELV
ncbi:ASCH domain-containing protein [Kineosporia succinea]|uniref:Uncharacterized protein YhfF n=1 Tax=Kineosporia succinea TaxID=84632 RepID=A0ABT9NVY3_9ACTN|nr:ASCH domain-containing protein [Kineosporia succinea]MDP9824590.1 uncharacterized protein YhfF [Kineosporia succinea]